MQTLSNQLTTEPDNTAPHFIRTHIPRPDRPPHPGNTRWDREVLPQDSCDFRTIVSPDELQSERNPGILVDPAHEIQQGSKQIIRMPFISAHRAVVHHLEIDEAATVGTFVVEEITKMRIAV
jgi:hypothetical protein